MTMSSAIFLPLLILHIAAGLVALSSGVVAMMSRKSGGGLHARAGHYFYMSMSAMAVSAALLTAWEPDRLSLGAAIWTFYLVHTSRLSAISRTGKLDRVSQWLAPVGLFATLLFLHGGLIALDSANGEFQDMPATAYFVFGSLASLSLLFDLSVLYRGGLKPRQRVARHLWRMMTAYFLAATSLFLGQQDDVFPFMKGSPILLLPSLFTLGFLTFWAIRVRFARNWLGNRSTNAVQAKPAQI
jgi:uncharacterized membrane protein